MQRPLLMRSLMSLWHKGKEGDILCIIEAMKLMNEITSDRDGRLSGSASKTARSSSLRSRSSRIPDRISYPHAAVCGD